LILGGPYGDTLHGDLDHIGGAFLGQGAMAPHFLKNIKDISNIYSNFLNTSTVALTFRADFHVSNTF
jgi:hypothetical protein